MGRIFRGLVWVITLGYVNLDPNAPPDYTKDKKKLKADIEDCENQLKDVRKDLKAINTELEKLEADVAKCKKEGKKADRQTLFDIMLKRDDKAKYEASETMLCRNLRTAKRHMSMIAIYEHSKPIEVREEVRRISDRIKVRIDTIETDEEETGERTDDLSDDIAISDLDAKLERLEQEIVSKHAERAEPVTVAEPVKAETPVTPAAARREEASIPLDEKAQAILDKLDVAAKSAREAVGRDTPEVAVPKPEKREREAGREPA